MYIGRLCSITKDYDSIEIVIMSDFNANLDYVYFAEWRTACEQYSLTFSDMRLLPSDIFTHLNNGSFSKYWLDHVLSSQSVHMSTLDISVDNNFFLSDHFPLWASLCYERLTFHLAESDPPKGIEWTFSDALEYCEVSSHEENLNNFWNTYLSAIREVGAEMFGSSIINWSVTPAGTLMLNYAMMNLEKLFLDGVKLGLLGRA